MKKSHTGRSARSAKGLIVVYLLLVGCASEIIRSPTHFSPSSAVMGLSEIRTVNKNLTLTLNSGYHRPIKQNSQWRLVGEVPQGMVFAPVNDVFTVEGAQIHEAYLVVKNGLLNGFYLPVEKAYSGLLKSLYVSVWEE